MAFPPLLVGSADGLVMLGSGEPRALAGHDVNALARQERRTWAILDGREIWQARDGAAWEPVTRANGLQARCLLPIGSALLVGTSEAHLLHLEDTTLHRVKSFDEIEGREDWFTPWGGPPDTRSLAAGPTGIVFATVHVGGVPRSTDRGRSWHPTMDIQADCHEVIAHPADASMVLAATAIGLGISADAGSTWKFETAGLHATYQRAVAVSGDQVLVSSSRSERGAQAAVYRFALGKRTRLVKCDRGLPKWFSDNIDTGCLIARDEAAVLGTPDGAVFVSEDLGETWRLLKDGLPRIKCLAFI